MPQVDQIQIGSTTYDILQSTDATFTGTSNDTTDASATSWTSVETLASSETNGSIFTKISSMFKNIRYLYSKIGELDIGEAGTSVSDAIKNLYENKADKNHTHDTSTLETADGQPLITNTQTTATNRAASAKLVYDMNVTLSEINSERSKYVNNLKITNNSTITLFHGNTSVSTATLTTATSAAIGLLRKLEPASTTKFLRADGTWQVNSSGTTYANLKGCTTAAAGTAGLAPAAAAGAINRYLRCDATWQVPPNTNTTYAFSNKGVTLAWNTQSTIAVCGGTNITVKMPPAPTNTTYGTSAGCYGSLVGTTLTLNERNFRV